MSTGIQFDEAWSRRVEAIYTTSDVVAQRRAVLSALELRPGEHVLDVGSGPGLLAFDMGTAVGETGAVKGIDLSESMVALSQRRCAGMPWVECRVGDATALPLFNPQYHADTYSHGVIDFVASFVPGRQGVTQEEAAAWAD